jgi:hypothetical protein
VSRDNQGQLPFAEPLPPPVRLMARLSEQLGGPVRPDRCQGCGSVCDLALWQEHDEQDRPEPIVIILCERCSKRTIGPHPRLYAELERNRPWPGAMAICDRCRFRDRLRCTHPAAKANGGAGVELTIARPVTAHLSRSPRRLSGFVMWWPHPATDCDRREMFWVNS